MNRVTFQEPTQKLAVMVVLLAAACIATYYFRGVFETGIVVTHFYYFPIVLASFWWKRQGLSVAVFLGAVLLASHIILEVDEEITSDLILAAIFVSVGLVVARVSERIAEKGRKLRESEERYRVLVETSDEPIALKDAMGRYILANQAHGVLYGKRKEEYVGKRPTEIVDSEAMRAAQEVDDRVLHQGKPVEYEESLVAPRGTILLLTRKTPIRNDDGQVVGLLGISRDITERKQAEDTLRESEEKYKLLADNSADIIYTLNIENEEYTYVSPTVEKILGYTPEEALSLKPKDILTPESYKEQLEAMQKELLKGGASTGTLQLEVLHKAGHTIPVEIHASFLLDESGKPTGILGVVRDITERKKAEEALRESEQFSFSLLNNSPNPIVVVNPDTSVRYGNHALEELTGFSSEEIAGRKAPYPWWTEESLSSISEDLREAMQHGAVNLEKLFQKKNGEQFWVEITSRPVVRDGDFIYYLSNWTDITERKKMEDALSHERDLMKRLFEHHPDVVYLKDREAKYLHVSKSFCDLFECAVEDIIGKTDFVLFPEQVAKRTYAEDIHIITTGEPLINKERRARDIWVLTTKMSWLDEKGKVIGLFGISRDITERKQSEDALRENEERYRVLVETSDDAIALKDSKGRWVMVNQAHADIHGKRKEDFAGKMPTEVVDSEAMRAAQEVDDRILHQGKAVEYEESLVAPRGPVLLLTRKTPIRNYDGQVVGLLGISRDITERKQSEKAREALVAELEAKNAELDRFAYSVSHDLKSPLVTINGFLGLLEQDAAAGNAERMRWDMARIAAATDHMRRLLDDLLEVSRIGRFVNPPEEVQLDGLAREVLDIVAGQIAERGVDIRVATGLPVLHGDRVRLRQMLQNLIDNAVKHMGDQPEPQVEIGVRQNGEETVCFVRDNGIGIDPRHHDRIFNLFDKLDQKSEGTGIGLALVKRIVEVHGGRIWVESEGVGHGSTFYFTLPVRA